jgi:uncharacterized membrane protein
MDSRVKVAGHSLHQMLIVFPLGLLATAVIFDVIYLVSDRSVWTQAAYYMITAGLIGGLAAAVPGWVDWMAVPGGTRAKRVGLIHGMGNVVLLALFILSWFLRRPDPTQPPTGAIVAGLAGAVLAAVTAWLGGELVVRLGVGVDDGAHLDAPSSLSAQSIAAAGRVRAESGYDRRAYSGAAYTGVERRVAGSIR